MFESHGVVLYHPSRLNWVTPAIITRSCEDHLRSCDSPRVLHVSGMAEVSRRSMRQLAMMCVSGVE